MRKTVKYLFFLFIALLIMRCTPTIEMTSTSSLIPMNSSIEDKKDIVAFIQPYKDSLEKEMSEILVLSSEEFPQEKNKAQTKLGNLVADLSLEIARDLYKDSIDFCLLNFGGLRTSLPKGEITRGKIFELMPFENELVLVTIDIKKMKEVNNYLKQSGGQPIAGDYRLKFGKLIMEGDVVSQNDSVWYKSALRENEVPLQMKILTTDYLANGGDNMKFFLNPINYEKVGIKLRDAIIQFCMEENKKGHQLTGKLDERIIFENNK